MVVSETPEIRGFLAKYDPGIAADLRAARKVLHSLVPNGYELVYDNYNALVFGFSPTPRTSDGVVSIAGYPKWATLFFLKGASLPDPLRVLSGTGSTVRSVRLSPIAVLDTPAVQALLAAALSAHAQAFAAAPRLTTTVKLVFAKQRPRRPASRVEGAAVKDRGRADA